MKEEEYKLELEKIKKQNQKLIEKITFLETQTVKSSEEYIRELKQSMIINLLKCNNEKVLESLSRQIEKVYSIPAEGSTIYMCEVSAYIPKSWKSEEYKLMEGIINQKDDFWELKHAQGDIKYRFIESVMNNSLIHNFGIVAFNSIKEGEDYLKSLDSLKSKLVPME